MDTKISIIIPTYNRPLKLARALESCINQSTPPFEVIVVDNGENSETRSVVETSIQKSELNVRYLTSEKFAHRKALANGIEAATGDWLTLLDDDDFLVPDRIANDCSLLEGVDTQVLMLIQDFIRVDYRSEIIWEHRMSHKELGLYQALTIDEFPTAAAVTFRTESIQKYHGFHLQDGWMTEFDLYANIRPHGSIKRSGKIGYIMDDTRSVDRVTGSDISKYLEALDLHRERFRKQREYLEIGQRQLVDNRLDQQQAFFSAKVLGYKAFLGETARYCRKHPIEALKGGLTRMRGQLSRLGPSMLPEMRGSITYTLQHFYKAYPRLSQLVETSKLDSLKDDKFSGYKVDLRHSITPWNMKTKLRRGIWEFIIKPIYQLIPGKRSQLRISILRAMGAQIGEGCTIQQRVDILIPWNLVLGDCVAVAHGCTILNFTTIEIGSMTVISQNAHLCAGTHDYHHPHFPLVYKPVMIEPESWVASGAFIGPGVHLGRGCVIGANSVVTKNMPEWTVCAGNPCIAIKARRIENSPR